ncbi:hypothetical protein Oter_1942 [Opitutus terrae PB90-1]|uniref:Uncharacterized protein n=2 Tax=Opitutus terrae TaxID=107709 RepID=B1ZY26_OPITP|nr:hypothetical protein Oter_1942 [Opitutus terrae PB90-1]
MPDGTKVYEAEIVLRATDGKMIEFVFAVSFEGHGMLKAQYEQFLRDSYAYVLPVISQRIDRSLEEGGTARIGKCTLHRDYVSFPSGMLALGRSVVPWFHVRTKLAVGDFLVFDDRDPRKCVAEPMVGMWNAAVLDVIAQVKRRQSLAR